MKICVKCGFSKDEDEFSWKNKAKRVKTGQCKQCQNLFNKTHHVQNRDHIRSLKKERWNEIKSQYKDWFYGLLKTKRCADCGETDSVVLQFDHKADKLFNIGDIFNSKKRVVNVGTSLDKLISLVSDEMKKCEIVCANCHTRRTAKVQGWRR